MDENLDPWAKRAGLTQPTIQSLQGKGFTSTLTLAKLTPEIIDKHFEELPHEQNRILKEVVKTLQEGTPFQPGLEDPRSSPEADTSNQQSASAASTIIPEPEGNQRRGVTKTRHYEGPKSIRILGSSGGRTDNINVVGYQVAQHQHVKHLKASVLNVEEQHLHREGPRGTLDERILDLKIQEAERVFVDTESYRRVESKLKKYGHLTICGASGEGKTTMSLILASHYREMGYEIVFVNKIDLFDLDIYIDSMPSLFLIIDDLFGVEGISADITKIREILDQLVTYMEHCGDASQNEQELTKSQKESPEDAEFQPPSPKRIVVVFSSKTYQFKEGISKLHYQRIRLFREETIVDLTEDGAYHYSQLDMEAIFQQHRGDKNVGNEQDLEKILSDKYELFGFPMTCQLYFRISSSNVNAVDFFENPLLYLSEELNDILRRNDDQTAVFILMFLCEDKLDLSKLHHSSSDPQLDKIMQIIPRFDDSIKMTIAGMYKEAKNFRGTFFIGGDSLSFAHSSIYDACACEIFKLNPSFILEHCSDNFLYERLNPQKADLTEITFLFQNIRVSENYHGMIANRLANVIKQGRFAKSVTHPILANDQVLEQLMKGLLDEEINDMSTEPPEWVHKRDQDKSFLYWAALGPRPEIIQLIEKQLMAAFTPFEIGDGIDGCVQKDNLQLLTFLYSKLDRRFTDINKNILLMSAVKYGSSRVAIYLLKEGADITATDEEMHNILHLACKNGQFDLICEVMKEAEIPESLANGKDKTSKTPIMYAALLGFEDFFQLFKPLSDMYKTDSNGNTPFHFACRGGNTEIVEDLLPHSNINSRNWFGGTPVMLAAATGQRQVFELLVSKKADLTLLDDNGSSVFFIACRGGNKPIIEYLLGSFDINCRGPYGCTPVMIAAVLGQDDTFDLLVSKNADLSLVDDFGDTVLHHACVGGSKSIVKHLVALKEINTRGQYGRTPIMRAALNGQQRAFELLNQGNADLKILDELGNTLLNLTCRGGNKLIVEKYLLPLFNINTKGEFGRTPIMNAANEGHYKLFEVLLSKKADYRLVDDGGFTLLHVACRGGSKIMTEYLLSLFNVNSRGYNGWTPVMVAVMSGQTDVFDLLVSQEADLAMVDDTDAALVHLACKGGHKSLLERTLTSSNINSRGENGWTPIMMAAFRGYVEIFDILFNSPGVDLTMVDGHGDSLLHLACQGGNRYIVETILPSVDINIRGFLGRTPIMMSAFKGCQDVFKFLSKRADTMLKDDAGDGLIHLASRSGNKYITEHVLSSSNINDRGEYGQTPIMMAASTGQKDVFEFLVSKEADVSLVDERGNNLFHLACAGGNKFIVLHLLTSTDINSRGEHGRTSIMMAAAAGHKDVFELLKSHGEDFQAVDELGNTILHLACKGGNKFIVQHLQSLDISSRGEKGQTPVMLAAVSGHKQIFELLYNSEKDSALRDDSDDTLLHQACQGGNKPIVQCMLSSLDINTRGHHGQTPIMKAASAGKKLIFEELLLHNPDLTLVDDYNNTALHFACKGGNKFILQQLLTSSNIDSTGEYGQAPVMIAALCGHKNIFDILISQKANLDLVDDTGNALIHMACMGGDRYIVEYLLSPANINARGEHGRTPIMMAAVSGHKDVFELLMSMKADLTLVDDHGYTLFHHVGIGGNKSIAQHLLSKSTINSRGEHGRTPIMMTAIHGKKGLFELLLSRNADISLTTDHGDTLLHLACQGGNKLIVQSLLPASNINCRGQKGLTPVMVAAFKGNKGVFDLLVSMKADLSLVEGYGRTLLHLACWGGNRFIVEHLLTPSNINSRGQYGKTPVMVAAMNGHRAVFELLVSRKANLELTDDLGNTLLNLGCHGGDSWIVDYLLPSSDINRRGEKCWTPVMNAANEGRHNIFMLLISKNADLTLTGGNGNTVLHLASQGGSKAIVQHLLPLFDINCRGEHGRTPIMMAALAGQKDVFELLLLNNADLKILDDHGDSVLHLACKGGNKCIAQKLLSLLNINQRGHNGFTPVICAANSGHFGVFELLMRQKTLLTLPTSQGNTLLHMACSGGNTLIVQAVLASSNINSRGPSGVTPVMCAAMKGHKGVFDMLSKKADLTIVADSGQTLLNLACVGGNPLIVRELLTPTNINNKGECGQTPIMTAALHGQIEVFRLLVSKKANLTLIDDAGDSLLHLACKGGNEQIVQYLLSPTNINSRGCRGLTPVMIAAAKGHKNIFDLLISNSADLSLVNALGYTLFEVACFGGHKPIMQCILSPSNINRRFNGDQPVCGLTPVMLAALMGQNDVYELLVSMKANLTLVDGNGNTILHLGCKGGSTYIIQDLLTPSNINSKGEYGRTPIMIAAINAQQSVFDFLLSKKADIRLLDDYGNNLFACATVGGDKVILSRLACKWCNQPALLSCGQCHSVRYCSKKCQRNHWKSEHKDICKALTENV